MKARKANLSDLPKILQIYHRARGFMEQSGNPTQWGNVYPPESLVTEDISRGYLYVLEHFFDKQTEPTLCGVFAFLPDGDEIYNNIEGKWLNDLPHSAIHRVASSGEVPGVLPACVEFCLSVSKNLKIDTHTDNKIMQHQLIKAGFSPCGKIFLPDGSERIAFQLYKQ